MNSQLIKKIITSNNLPCPEFTFENPLLDKNVAEILSKSFVKILNLSQQNSNINNNMRVSILEIIRKMCQIEPENHIKVDESITSLLTEVYEQKIKNVDSVLSDNINKDLDAYLIRNIKGVDINSSYNSSVSPEIMQALNNLNSDKSCLNNLTKNLIHWDSTDNKNIYILKQLWASDDSMSEDISIKLKSEIEKILLEICKKILTDTDLNIEELFATNNSLIDIVKKSTESPNCFQTCCSIINYLFVMTNFNLRIQIFIDTFVKHVKENSSHISISVLYPTHLNYIVVLLDTDVGILPTSVKNDYIETTVKYLSVLQLESENDLIMLLSHYPKWFDIYLSKRNLA